MFKGLVRAAHEHAFYVSTSLHMIKSCGRLEWAEGLCFCCRPLIKVHSPPSSSSQPAHAHTSSKTTAEKEKGIYFARH